MRALRSQQVLKHDRDSDELALRRCSKWIGTFGRFLASSILRLGDMKMSDWFIEFNGEAMGPFSAAELKQRAAAGEVTPDTQICKAGTNKWAPASALKGLFPAAAITAASKAPAPAKSAISQPSPPPVPVAVAPQQTVPAEVVPNPMMIAPAPVFAQPMQPGITMMFAAPQPAASPPVVATPSRWARFGRLIGTSIFLLLVSAVATGLVFVTANKVSGLEAEIEELEEQRNVMEQEKRDLENKKKGLIQQQEELSNEIQNLTSMRDDLSEWQQMDVVMINPSTVAVGLVRGDGGELKLRKIAREGSTEEASAKLAIESSIDGGRAQFVSTDPQLTRDVAGTFTVGEVISGLHRDRIGKYWNDSQIVNLRADEEMECVSFLDATNLKRRIGLFLDADAASLTFHEAAAGRQSIDRKLIVPGSAIRGTIEQILPSLDEMTLVDQACLRVAQHLQGRTGEFQAHSIAVHVASEMPNMDHYWQLRKRYYTPDGFRTNNAYLDYPQAAVIMFSMIRNEAIRSEENAEIDRLRSIITAVEVTRMKICDDVVSKLLKTGLTTVSRAQEEHLAEVLGLSDNPWDSSRYQLLPASHRLEIKVQPPVEEGRCRLVVSLVDNRNGSVIFSESSDPVYESIYDNLPRREKLLETGLIQSLSTTNRKREYFMDSGRLGLLTVKPTAGSEYRPLESPLVVDRTTEQATKTLTDLVYIESSEGTYPLKYRSLFSKRRYELPESHIESLQWPDNPDDIPKADIFRYVACRIARKTMPAAGRIRSVDGNSVIVSIGRESGIAVGETMRLLRYFDEGYRIVIDELSGEEAEAFLPIRLTVTEVHDHHCRMQVTRSGFEDIWPEDYQFREGDIVVPMMQKKSVIGVLPPLGQYPDRKAKAAQNANNWKKELQAVRDAMNVSGHFAREMTDALNSLNIATREISNPYGVQRVWPHGFLDSDTLRYQIQAMRQAGVTHIVAGYLQPVGGSQYRMRIGILPADYQVNDDADFNDTFDFKLNSSIIPK